MKGSVRPQPFLHTKHIIWNTQFPDCRVLLPGFGLLQTLLIIFSKIFQKQLFQSLKTREIQRALHSGYWLLSSEALLDLIRGKWAQECTESIEWVLLYHLIESHQHFLLVVQLIASCVQAVRFAEEKLQLLIFIYLFINLYIYFWVWMRFAFLMWTSFAFLIAQRGNKALQ